MTTELTRLRAVANHALAEYSDQLMAGGEPYFPQWAKDAVEVCNLASMAALPARWQQAAIEAEAAVIVERAALAGVVLTIEQLPLLPLAMGHYESIVSVRPARGQAK